MNTYIVHCERDEAGWWVATVPELPGVVTQARGLEAIQERVREAIALWLDIEDENSFDITLEVVGAEAALSLWHQSRELFRQCDEAAARGGQLAREAVSELGKDLGLSVRDAALVLGVSFQRVQQLAPKERAGGQRKSAAKSATSKTNKLATPKKKAAARKG